jgi:hypothetical protein
MDKESLGRITGLLESALKELSDLSISDAKLRSIYAEWLVAYELAKRGHKVQLRNERENTNADIYIVDKKRRVEVKSGKYDDKGWTDASFGRGKQISEGKFDYSVFVTFSKEDDSKVEEMFIFTIGELKQIADPGRNVAIFQKTNPCLLLRCKNLKIYKDYIKDRKSVDVEDALNEHPEKYDRAWDKIN